VTFGDRARKCASKSIWQRANSFVAKAFAHFDAIARRFLQQVELPTGFGLAGIDALA
jgi:hypothetical protein